MAIFHFISIFYSIYFIQKCNSNEIPTANFSISLNIDYNEVKVDLCKRSLNTNTVPCPGHEYDDFEESDDFLEEYFPKNRSASKAMACGTSIYRVNEHILEKMFGKVDTVELNLNTIPTNDHENLTLLYTIGLRSFHPDKNYDLIWFQWVLKYLETEDAVILLVKCRQALNPNGSIVIKEVVGVTNDGKGLIPRTYKDLVDVQKAAGLKIVKEECLHKNYAYVHTFLSIPMTDHEWSDYQSYINASAQKSSALWTVSGVLINMVGQGMALSYPSALMPALKADDAEIKASLNIASWISSSIGVGGIPGFFLSSYCMERFGRRIAHAVVIIPGAVGWILIYSASDTTTLIIGRLLCGVTSGATVGLGAVVIGEYSCPKNRGMFLNLKTTSVCLGGTILHVLSNFYTWRTIAWISLIPYVVALMVIMTWPESPAWLAAKGEIEKSDKSFYWLRGRDKESQKEFKEMIQAQTNRLVDDKSFKEKVSDFLRKFTKKDFLKPVFIIMVGAFLLEVSGRHLFPAYALDIIGEITGNKKQSFYFTLALDLIILTSSSFASVLVKMMKRRSVLFGTGFPAVIVVFAACLYLFLVAKGVISNNYPWVPIGMFIVFFILVNLGCTPIPLAFLGELLPLPHRGAGSSVAGIIMSLALNLGLQVTPFLLLYCKVYGTFTVLGASMGILLLILYFMLPETKDRTLQEIEDYFNNGKFKDDADETEYKMISDTEIKLL